MRSPRLTSIWLDSPKIDRHLKGHIVSCHHWSHHNLTWIQEYTHWAVLQQSTMVWTTEQLGLGPNKNPSQKYVTRTPKYRTHGSPASTKSLEGIWRPHDKERAGKPEISAMSLAKRSWAQGIHWPAKEIEARETCNSLRKTSYSAMIYVMPVDVIGIPTLSQLHTKKLPFHLGHPTYPLGGVSSQRCTSFIVLQKYVARMLKWSPLITLSDRLTMNAHLVTYMHASLGLVNAAVGE